MKLPFHCFCLLIFFHFNLIGQVKDARKGEVSEGQFELLNPQNPRELAKAVLTSFKTADEKLYSNTFLKEKDCEIIVNNSTDPDSLKAGNLVALKMMIRKPHVTKTNFERVFQEVELKGVVWGQVELVDVYFELDEKLSDQKCDVFLSCNYQSKKFAIKLSECIRSDRWVMRGPTKIFFE
jgi:hypothetical protein